MVREKQVFSVLGWGMFYQNVGQVYVTGTLKTMNLGLISSAMCRPEVVSSWEKPGQACILNSCPGCTMKMD